MKKIVLPFIVSFVLLVMANQSLAVTATVNVTAVRIRETASTDSNIVTNVYQEDKVEILEENGEWYKVKYGEKVGYAKAEFFKKQEEKAESTLPQTGESLTNTTPQEPAATDLPAEPNSTEAQENIQSTVTELNVGGTISLVNTVKVRLIPNLSTNAKTELAKGTEVTIEAKLGNWYKIANENASGWITESKLTAVPTPAEQPPVATPEPTEPTSEPEPEPTPENTTSVENVPVEQPQETQTPTETTMHKTAVVIVETARVRDSASTEGNIIGVLDEDDIVTITGEEGKFYKISTSKISTGYISKTLVKEKDVTSRSMTEDRTSEPVPVAETVSPSGQNDVVAFAKQYLGYPYVLGCSSPQAGFDCSGFTRYVFAHFGYTLGRVAADQTSVGAVVERADLQTGDLLLFYDDGKTKIGHCGIYIGGGDFIHSANPKRGVVIDNLNTNSYYSQRFVTARRIIGAV